MGERGTHPGKGIRGGGLRWVVRNEAGKLSNKPGLVSEREWGEKKKQEDLGIRGRERAKKGKDAYLFHAYPFLKPELGIKNHSDWLGVFQK